MLAPPIAGGLLIGRMLPCGIASVGRAVRYEPYGPLTLSPSSGMTMLLLSLPPFRNTQTSAR